MRALVKHANQDTDAPIRIHLYSGALINYEATLRSLPSPRVAKSVGSV